MLGLVNDTGALSRLVMATEGRWIPEGDLPGLLSAKLADCLWWILVLSDRLDVDITEAFAVNRTESKPGSKRASSITDLRRLDRSESGYRRSVRSPSGVRRRQYPCFYDRVGWRGRLGIHRRRPLGPLDATWPLARLSIGPDGIRIRSSSRVLRRVVPKVDLAWDEVDRLELVVGALPMPRNFGVAIVNRRKKLMWWGGSSEDCRALIGVMEQFAPGRVSSAEDPRVVL